MTFTGPPHDVLEEYSRGIEEVEGGQEEALVGGSEGEMERRNLSMLLKYIKLNDFFSWFLSCISVYRFLCMCLPTLCNHCIYSMRAGWCLKTDIWTSHAPSLPLSLSTSGSASSHILPFAGPGEASIT